MSAPVIHLETYYLEKVLIERIPDSDSVEQISISFDYDYKVLRNPNKPKEFALTFIVRDDPTAQTEFPQAYKLDLRILGLFYFDEGLEEEKMQWLIRYNGGTILYGILRGMVTNITAAFPEGPFRMPTIMMDDVVQKVERSLIALAPTTKKVARKTPAKKSSKPSKRL